MPDAATSSAWPWLAGIALLGMALAFRPWDAWRAAALRMPWLACLLVLPLLWIVQREGPGGVPLTLSGACLLVLMFGWPLAVWTLLPVTLAAAVIGEFSAAHAASLLWWRGLLPATLALVVGLGTRRWLPRHVFVYILARAFIGSALAIGAAGALEVWLAPGTNTLTPQERWVAHWLIGWGEATATGMLVAVFVAFRPQWLLTYSDARYLPRRG